ncbi:hypothetical protein V6N12_033155 [Hibiscus sabdariffa]|uniref:ShKT domain-containing protein n=1 Tax=Hibiscus sabdariffa TaxID=183260 RepID=A0ABR2BCP3_9ROSI
MCRSRIRASIQLDDGCYWDFVSKICWFSDLCCPNCECNNYLSPYGSCEPLPEEVMITDRTAADEKCFDSSHCLQDVVKVYLNIDKLYRCRLL